MRRAALCIVLSLVSCKEDPAFRPAPAQTVGLAPRVVETVMLAGMPDFHACYQRALESVPVGAPFPSGVINLQFAIRAGDGQAVRAVVTSADPSFDPVLRSCFLGVVPGLRFPCFEGGDITVNYPFTLASPRSSSINDN